MEITWDQARQGFAEGAAAFVRTVEVVDGRWEAPGLGEWDVRALVGHTTRSLLTVEAYLQQPADAAEVATPADYVRRTRGIASGPAVAQRGRDAGAALGDDPVAAVRAIADRVLPLVAGCDGTELVTTIVGGMRLADYLPTRTFELVVHTADLARALDVVADVPPAPTAQALAIVAELALDDDRAVPLLLAATGRAPLPAGFSVL